MITDHIDVDNDDDSIVVLEERLWQTRRAGGRERTSGMATINITITTVAIITTLIIIVFIIVIQENEMDSNGQG